MSKKHTLNAHTRKRSGTGAINALRREGLIPAVVYGKAQENLNLRLSRKDVETVLSQSIGEQILVNLTIEDLSTTKLALIQSVQHDPLNGRILHIDFHSVREDEIIHASVPLELIGDAAGAKQGGLVEHLIHNLAINCLAKDLPEVIQVDISELGLTEALHIKELKLPAGVTTAIDGDVVVVMVAEPRVADPALTAEPAAKAAPAKAAPAKAATAAPKK